MKNISYIFSYIGKIQKSLRDKFVYIFLDYDGTLAPIAKTPGAASMPARTKELLRRLSNMPNCKVAIVSGRSLRDISRRVGLKGIIYVGNHGFEIKGPGIKLEDPTPLWYRRRLTEIKSRLKKNLSGIRGVLVEDKAVCLSIHYRLVNRKDVPKVIAGFRDAILPYGKRNIVKITSGKQVLEIRPPVSWDKGQAVLWLLRKQRPNASRKKTELFPIYIGDDATDEDAFEALGGRGMTIYVGRSNDTKARYIMENNRKVPAFLKEILNNMSARYAWLKKI